MKHEEEKENVLALPSSLFPTWSLILVKSKLKNGREERERKRKTVADAFMMLSWDDIRLNAIGYFYGITRMLHRIEFISHIDVPEL